MEVNTTHSKYATNTENSSSDLTKALLAFNTEQEKAILLREMTFLSVKHRTVTVEILLLV